MPQKFTAERPHIALLSAALLFTLFAATTLLWISLDHFPPNWDDAWYLTKSLAVYDSGTDKGVAGYFSSLNEAFGFKAPLIAGLPSPLYLLFGRRWHAAYLVNIVSMFVLFVALYRIGYRSWTRRTGVIAIAVAGTMPLLYGLVRWYLVEYSLTALVCCAMAVLLESDSLQDPVLTLIFGAICGFGLLLKASFVLFLLPPVLFAWFPCRRRKRAAVLTVIPCLAIALPWYAVHWHPVLVNALDAAYGTPAAVQGTGPIFSLSAILTYLEGVARSGISVYFAALAVALIAIAPSRLTARNLRFLLFWLLPFAVFLFGGNKDVRYIAPILPAVALLIAALLDAALPPNWVGSAIAMLLLVFPLLSVFAVSFGVPWHAQETAYARRYAPRPWPHDEMLRLVASHIPRDPTRRPLLLVGSDRAALNANNIELTAVALRLPLRIETTAHETNANTLFDRLDQSEFFLYEERGEPESAVFNPHFAAIVQRVKSSDSFTEIPYGKLLPDGGTARLFRRLSQPAIVQPPPREEFAINFGEIFEATSVVARQESGSVAVRYVWRQLQPSSQECWSFTHLIDSTGKIVAQSDRPLPLVEPERVAQQEIRIPLPASTPISALRIRFGLYNPPTSVRLPIGSLPLTLTIRFTLADHGTALITPIQ